MQYAPTPNFASYGKDGERMNSAPLFSQVLDAKDRNRVAAVPKLFFKKDVSVCSKK